MSGNSLALLSLDDLAEGFGERAWPTSVKSLGRKAPSHVPHWHVYGCMLFWETMSRAEATGNFQLHKQQRVPKSLGGDGGKLIVL